MIKWSHIDIDSMLPLGNTNSSFTKLLLLSEWPSPWLSLSQWYYQYLNLWWFIGCSSWSSSPSLWWLDFNKL